MKIIFFTEETNIQKLSIPDNLNYKIFSSLSALREGIKGIDSLESCILISFGIGEIIPETILNLFYNTYNVHAASPDFPGRDPHHHAIYNQSKSYGAVIHIMTNKVDDGLIVACKMFPINSNMTAPELLELSNLYCIDLLNQFLKKISKDEKIIPLDINWGEKKYKRSDLLKLSKISITDSEEEVKRKYHAFQKGVNYKNLYIEHCGLKFRFDSTVD